MVKNWNFDQKLKFWSKIGILVKHRVFGQKSKFQSKNRNFSQKIKILVKNRNFSQKIKILVKNCYFGQKRLTSVAYGKLFPTLP